MIIVIVVFINHFIDQFIFIRILKKLPKAFSDRIENNSKAVFFLHQTDAFKHLFYILVFIYPEQSQFLHE